MPAVVALVERVERVALHPDLTERILARCGAWPTSPRRRRPTTSEPTERLPQGVATLMPAQLLAAADVYSALREDWPHRAAVDEGESRVLLAGEADTGRLNRRARRRGAGRGRPSGAGDDAGGGLAGGADRA